MNRCIKCGISFYVKDLETDSKIIIQGEVSCCCGDYDENGNIINGFCGECCPKPEGPRIYDGMTAGGGSYEVNVRG